MKLKTVFVCQSCAFQSTKWAGKCPNCSAWNSFAEDVINVGKEEKSSRVVRHATAEKPQSIRNIPSSPNRLQTGIGELDPVIGGGFVEGGLTLLAGEPGIGKSTLTLQIVGTIATQGKKVLYITGEESTAQVGSRAERMGITNENIHLQYESQLEAILLTIQSFKPDFLVLDSIQVLYSEEIAGTAGSISQVRYVTESVMHLIKTLKITTLLIGHVNKEGNIAGPKVLEHLVDTVLILEGERDQELRMLRSVKNRFGSVNEVGLFEMKEEGLAELKNPGQHVLQSRAQNPVGSCLTITMEGNRPLLLEVQALVNHSPFGYPKRMASGFDRNRLELLIAVIQKHSSLNLADQDVFVSVTGGLRIQDPAADLAVCSAIISSFLKRGLPETAVVFGELGLTGEVRLVYREKDRTQAAKKLGLSPLSSKSLKSLLDQFKGF